MTRRHSRFPPPKNAGWRRRGPRGAPSPHKPRRLAGVVRAVMGSEAVALCACAPEATSILGHGAAGYAAHVWGERLSALSGAEENGTNIWVLGVLSFREGFHSNHHVVSGSARLGQKAHELDLGWWAIPSYGYTAADHDPIISRFDLGAGRADGARTHTQPGGLTRETQRGFQALHGSHPRQVAPDTGALTERSLPSTGPRPGTAPSSSPSPPPGREA